MAHRKVMKAPMSTPWILIYTFPTFSLLTYVSTCGYIYNFFDSNTGIQEDDFQFPDGEALMGGRSRSPSGKSANELAHFSRIGRMLHSPSTPSPLDNA